MLLSGSDIQAAWNTNDHLFSTQEKIQALLGQMHENRERISQEKFSLENAQEDREMLLAAKNAQKQTLAANQADVADDVEDQEATVDELQEKLREMQSDLTVITGKSFNAKDIREAVEFASKQTGVPKGVLYGFLKMETNLGANTGQCTYDQVKKDALSRYYNKNKKKYKNSIALLEKRYNLFVTLTKKLDYSKNKKVSCTPSGYVGQGGAMGVPQFMSDTWQGYASQVASKTGHATPDPWDLGDGVMAMALKLRAAGATLTVQLLSRSFY
ncbi:MAG: lytic murein transglycosylase [Candidatus Moraniibacteriota bacterium]